jgi:hypothetical protein
MPKPKNSPAVEAGQHPVTIVKPWPKAVLKSPVKWPGQTSKTSPTQK